MSYPNQQPGNGRSRRGPNLFLLLMMGAMAMFLYSQYQRGKQQQVAVPDIAIPDISNDDLGTAGDRLPPGRERSMPIDGGGQPVDQRKNAGSDWSIDTEIPSTSRGTTNAASTAQQTETGDAVANRGDWSLEVGDSNPSRDPNASPLKTAKPKTTRDGDWSIGEVETKK